MAENNPSPTTTINTTFSEPEADIVLRSSDNVDFKTTKAFLATVSPTFNTLLRPELQGTPVFNADIFTHEDLPVLLTHTPKNGLEALLRFRDSDMLPQDSPSIYHAVEAYVAADKYVVDGAREWAKKQVMRFAGTQPASVFAFAMKFGWYDEAKIAAEKSLSFSLQALTVAGGSEVLEVDMRPLWRFHGNCRHNVINLFNKITLIFERTEYSSDSPYHEWQNIEWQRMIDRQPMCCSTRYFDDEPRSPTYGTWYLKEWFCFYLEALAHILRDKPDARLMEDEAEREVFSTALSWAGRCPTSTCAPGAPEQLGLFRRIMIFEVNKTRGYVSIFLVPVDPGY